MSTTYHHNRKVYNGLN